VLTVKKNCPVYWDHEDTWIGCAVCKYVLLMQVYVHMKSNFLIQNIKILISSIMFGVGLD